MVTVLAALLCTPVCATSTSPAEQAKSLIDAYHGSFSPGDADGRAALFAEDAIWFNAFGARREGREAIRQMWRELFSRGIFDDASIEILGTSTYELSPTLVVVDQVEKLVGQRTPSGRELELRFVHLTFIVERHDEDWLITYYRAADLHRPPQWTPTGTDMPSDPSWQRTPPVGGDGPAADAAGADAAMAAFVRAWTEEDAEGVLGAFLPDAVVFDPVPPGTFSGSEVIRQWVEDSFRQLDGIAISLDVKVETGGSVAWHIGRSVFRATMGDVELMNEGPLTVVWVRQPDGAYRISAFHASLDPEPTAP